VTDRPSHTHQEHGGRYTLLGEHAGGGTLEGHTLIMYRDLDKGLQSLTTADDWRNNWRAIANDDCPICLGSGTDQIKGNTSKPCGACFGLGKVKADGETPTDRWELADIANGIIRRQQTELQRLRRITAVPEIQQAIGKYRDDAGSDWMQDEQEWRSGPGRGPGGRRYTGD